MPKISPPSHLHPLLFQILDPPLNGPTFKLAYTRRQINLYRMFFADFSVNSQPILMKFCKDYLRVFSSHAATAVNFSLENIV